ncbi:hypothetical protein ES702_07883 [subsurface metagenome]
MSLTYSVKCPSVEKKKEIQEKIGKMVQIDSQAENNYQALSLALDSYFDISQGSIPDPPFLEKTYEILASINCPWLKYEAPDFKCFELFHRRKKPESLGEDPDKIPERCSSCREGKAEQIREQYQKKLRGHNIQGLLGLINLFQKFAKEGVPSTIYFCNRIPDNQLFTGLKTIKCTLINSTVPIERCKEKPCEYFEEYTIAIKQDFPEQTLKLIEGIAQDVKRIENLSPKKQVKSEQVI